MRTRSPSNRNSLGSRTAWLRPFWKSLAVSVLGMKIIYINNIYHTIQHRDLCGSEEKQVPRTMKPRVGMTRVGPDSLVLWRPTAYAKISYPTENRRGRRGSRF